MCRTKKSTSVVEPRNRNRNRNTKRNMHANNSHPQPTRTLTSSSSNYESSTSDVPITESRSYVYDNTKNRDWSKSSSISSRASLSSLKDTLPENPNIYNFSEISAATSNLSTPRLSSSSWRCFIRDRDVVVFQRKFRRQFDLSELRHRLALICRSHHSSLVKLLGASISGNYIFLVYDFVPGASLVDCLRNRRNPSFTDLSTWTSRMQIASDIAHGLDYIHNSSGSGFVHNHIKSSSIVVAEDNFSAKICHFGTSDLCGEAVGEVSGARLDRSGSRTVRFEGTRGYMAPEFQVTGVATQKTDVYAFGVVVLELLSGDEAVRFEFDDDGSYKRVSVVETARVAVEENGGARKWVDKRLRDSFPMDVAERMIRVGLECVEDDPNKRPDMGRVSIEVSKLYLESKKWAENMGTDIDLSVSLAPR
ncbi:lysM domain receptor-like kinase 3 [Abrus precatorius]|uniref:LysM domain receptor-like kinase 3 n=1 Tax=Abrus precatorius TaxID=3816 RepID=A0A8B8MHM7_ABRPR|nr:lysM domain receptor-like kinase 3 [Abrus precatorius]